MIKKVHIQKLKGAKFTIIPTPFQDELFSSWLIRTAYAHNTHPHTFANQYIDYRYNAFFRTDPDVSLEDYACKAIEHQCNDRLNLYNLTLKTYGGYLQEDIRHPNLFLSDLKFCPMCLKEDKIIYFRKVWRIEFYNICEKHKCYLLDKCPQCSRKIDISKMFKDKLPYTNCYKCGFDFKSDTIQREMAYGLALKNQNRIFRIIKQGYILLDKQPVYSFLFFDVFNHISKMILCGDWHLFIDKYALNEQLEKIECKNYIRGKPLFKQLSIPQKAVVFSIIIFLFERYPKKFEEFVAANEIIYWELIQDMRFLPFWYKNLVH